MSNEIPESPSGEMSFSEALRAASNRAAIEARVYRVDGPSFIVDELGQVRFENDCLYLGDMLDLHDWHVEPA